MSENTNQATQENAQKYSVSLLDIIKGAIILACIGFAIYSIITLFGGFSGVSGKNIKYESKTENAVYVYSVCPKCDHVGELYEVKISPGEDDKAMEVCDSCNHMFEMYVERK